MKRLALVAVLLLLTVSLWAQTPVTVVAGTIQDVGGNLATSGTVQFLVQPQSGATLYRVPGAGVVNPITTCGISAMGQLQNAALSGPCLIWGNDLIVPGNTQYQVVFNPNGQPATSTISSLLIVGSNYDLTQPVFGPSGVKIVPQSVSINTAPIGANIVPSADGVFNIGSQLLGYSQGWFNQLTVKALGGFGIVCVLATNTGQLYGVGGPLCDPTAGGGGGGWSPPTKSGWVVLASPADGSSGIMAPLNLTESFIPPLSIGHITGLQSILNNALYSSTYNPDWNAVGGPQMILNKPSASGTVTQVNPVLGGGVIAGFGIFGFANPTSTPTLSITPSSAGSHTSFGNCAGVSGPPGYCNQTPDVVDVPGVSVSIPVPLSIGSGPLQLSGTEQAGISVTVPAGKDFSFFVGVDGLFHCQLSVALGGGTCGSSGGGGSPSFSAVTSGINSIMTAQLAPGASLFPSETTVGGGYGSVGANQFLFTALTNYGASLPVQNKAACDNAPQVKLCPANEKSHVIGICISHCGTGDLAAVLISNNLTSLIFDSSHAVVAGDWVVTSATAGLGADTGSATMPTCGNEVLGIALSGGAAGSTQTILTRIITLPSCSSGLVNTATVPLAISGSTVGSEALIAGTDTSVSSNTYTVPVALVGTCPTTHAGLLVGMEVAFTPHANNTVAHPTLDVCGFASPDQIWVYGDAPLATNIAGVGADLSILAQARVQWDGTYWQLLNPETMQGPTVVHTTALTQYYIPMVNSAVVPAIANSHLKDQSGVISTTEPFLPAAYQSNYCHDSTGACSGATASPSGSVSIAAAATTVVVSTTKVTANSQIFIQEDSSLGSALSVTCNTTISRTYAVTARTAGTSFTISSSVAPSANPACLNYWVVN